MENMKSFFHRISSSSQHQNKGKDADCNSDCCIPPNEGFNKDATSTYLTPHTHASIPNASNEISTEEKSPATQSEPLTVIELFQSQGCNSCPPTNANLLSLVFSCSSSQQPPILLLTHHVTYWDYLGWHDTFGLKASDRRQRDYVERMGLRSAFTPQVVVNGVASEIGNTERALTKVLREGTIGGAEMRRRDVTVEVLDFDNGENDGKVVRVAASAVVGEKRSLHVTLVTYDPALQPVSIKRGENAGSVLPHANVVKDIVELGVVELGNGSDEREGLWNGGIEQKGLRKVVLIQEGRGGRIAGSRLL